MGHSPARGAIWYSGDMSKILTSSFTDRVGEILAKVVVSSVKIAESDAPNDVMEGDLQLDEHLLDLSSVLLESGVGVRELLKSGKFRVRVVHHG